MSAAPDLDVSVIIATRNRATLLADTLGHIARQEVGGLTWEAIVVDNGSTDRTAAVLESARGTLPLVALTEPRPGKNRAMNRALEAARGRLLIFSDDDVVPGPGWVREMAGAADRWKEHGILGGPVLLTFPAGTPEWLKECALRGANLPQFVQPQGEGPLAHAPFGPNYAVRRALLAGLRFDEGIGPTAGTSYAMGSETELLVRLMKHHGVGAVYVPDAAIQHLVLPTQLETASLLRRAFRSGRSAVRLGWDWYVTRRGRPILGAPAYLWRMALMGGANYALRLPAGRRRSLAAGLRFSYLLGCLHEHRSRAAASGQAIPLPS
ncbi:MAG TPA: glycosyltransferase family 2 protein [Gemmatimonadales bacterium]